jgi:hypothetical protein
MLMREAWGPKQDSAKAERGPSEHHDAFTKIGLQHVKSTTRTWSDDRHGIDQSDHHYSGNPGHQAAVEKHLKKSGYTQKKPGHWANDEGSVKVSAGSKSLRVHHRIEDDIS